MDSPATTPVRISRFVVCVNVAVSDKYKHKYAARARAGVLTPFISARVWDGQPCDLAIEFVGDTCGKLVYTLTPTADADPIVLTHNLWVHTNLCAGPYCTGDMYAVLDCGCMYMIPKMSSHDARVSQWKTSNDTHVCAGPKHRRRVVTALHARRRVGAYTRARVARR